jgi:hypothetical protein
MTLPQQLAALGRMGIPPRNIDMVLQRIAGVTGQAVEPGDIVPNITASFSSPSLTAPVLASAGAGSRSGVAR